MALTGNTIDMSHLSSATYIVKALDKEEKDKILNKFLNKDLSIKIEENIGYVYGYTPALYD